MIIHDLLKLGFCFSHPHSVCHAGTGDEANGVSLTLGVLDHLECAFLWGVCQGAGTGISLAADDFSRRRHDKPLCGDVVLTAVMLELNALMAGHLVAQNGSLDRVSPNVVGKRLDLLVDGVESGLHRALQASQVSCQPAVVDKMPAAVSMIALGEATEGDRVVVVDMVGEDVQGACEDGGEVLERFCLGVGHHGYAQGVCRPMRDGKMF